VTDPARRTQPSRRLRKSQSHAGYARIPSNPSPDRRCFVMRALGVGFLMIGTTARAPEQRTAPATAPKHPATADKHDDDPQKPPAASGIVADAPVLTVKGLCPTTTAGAEPPNQFARQSLLGLNSRRYSMLFAPAWTRSQAPSGQGLSAVSCAGPRGGTARLG